MKQIYLLATCLLSLGLSAAPLRFAVMTDTHVEAPQIVYDTLQTVDSLTLRDTTILVPRAIEGEALQALAICAQDVRNQQVDFILHAGDMTDNGDSLELVQVRRLLDATELPYYVTTGNHETKRSRSALQDVKAVFDSARFMLNTNGLLFLGLNNGPIMRASDGHFAPQDTLWLRQWLDSLGTQPTFVITHMAPRKEEVDNWYDLTNILRQYNTQAIIGGHHHVNEHLVTDGIDNVLCRSMLPDEEGHIGYTIVEIDETTIRFIERVLPGVNAAPTNWAGSERPWLNLPLKRRTFADPDTTLLPSYAVNDSDSLVVREWLRQLPAPIYATPAERYGRIYVGDDNGTFYAFDIANGRILWRYKTTGRIVGSADVKDGRVVFASANGTVYCLSVDNGKPLWRQKLGKPVTGSVTIDGSNVYVGSSDSCFYALKLMTGAPVWTYRGLGNYCIAKPLVYKSKIYFGAYDGNFYAFDKRKGKLLWRWSNDSTDYRLSPAAVTPCADAARVYFAAPDGYLTALRTDSGTVSIRTNRWAVRESIGMKDSILYAKTTNDTIIAINLNADTLLWATAADYGYDCAPTQLMADGSTLFFTTKNGLVTALDALTGERKWQHKLGNSLLTTPCTLGDTALVVASTDGRIALLRKRAPIPVDTLSLPIDSLMIDSLMIDTLALPTDTIAR